MGIWERIGRPTLLFVVFFTLNPEMATCSPGKQLDGDRDGVILDAGKSQVFNGLLGNNAGHPYRRINEVSVTIL